MSRRDHHHGVRHSRRGFLRLSAAAAAGVMVASRRSRGSDAREPHPADLPEDAASFPLGVAAGAISVDGAALWTRFRGAGTLRLVVWRGDGARWRQVLRQDHATPADGPLLVPVDGLAAHAEHRYAFYVIQGGVPLRRSRVGRFKTAAPQDALVPVTLGATCCTMNGMDQRVLSAAGARRDLDALIQLGDTVYADGSTTLADYRARWADNLGKSGYQALRASTGLFATWDDHEVDNDWDPETVAPAKLLAARDAFFEHMPICRQDGCPERIWRKQRFGRTVELFMLDSRSERARSASPKKYLGDEQMAWLKQGLKESDAHFKVIANSVPIASFPTMFATSVKDRWETFPEARTEILSFIEGESIPGVLWLAGDFHMAMIGRVSAHGPGSRSLEVLAGPGAQVGHPFVAWLNGNKQYDWWSTTNNVTALHFDPAKNAVDIRFHDENDRVFHRASYRRRASTGFEKA